MIKRIVSITLVLVGYAVAATGIYRIVKGS